MIKLAAQVVPIKVDAEKEGKDLRQKYGVKGFPTILFLDTAGEIMGRIGGYLPPGDFADEMTKVITLYKQFPEVEAKLKQNPDDGEANVWMAMVLVAREKTGQAEAALAKSEKAKYEGELLAQAYNAIGDCHQNAGELDEAIGFFKKADAAAKNAKDRAYAKISMAFCYQGKGDTANAKKSAEELIAMKDAPKAWVEQAKAILQPPEPQKGKAEPEK